ncbi:zinc-binding dehydrogenase [Thioalkalivibrio sp. ALJ1]|uniref:zinc-dependent alcohol dehydrogenase n=1 Tax=Thioalkalivibrio sp. ALJ1 TaxID=1158144 RepID=UPI00056FC67C|nr:zinc-binding dehydrogenase [Thioalkalivibrio sp. ALJ1]
MSARPTGRQAIVLRATDEPVAGTTNPPPHQRYRHPQISLEPRGLGPLAPENVRVEMLYAGLCGTDIHLTECDRDTGYVRSSAPAHLPPEGRILGHEGVGRVLESGTDVHHLQTDDIVAFASIQACWVCDTCKQGAPNQCPEARLLGTEIDGLFATVADIPAVLALHVSSTPLADEEIQAAACLEPAGCALLACEKTAIRPSDRVLVLGGGPIGQYAALAASRRYNAAHVQLIEPLRVRRELARQWCDEVATPDQLDHALRGGVDVVLECSGDLSVLDTVFPAIRPEGRVALLGRNGQPLHLKNVDHMITNAIQLVGSRGHLGGPQAQALALHRNGILPLLAPVTGTLSSLDELAELLQDPARAVQGHCKLLIDLSAT